jgi:hypothetical protein
VNDPSSEDNAQVSLTFSQTGMPSVTTVPAVFDDPNVLDGSAGYVNSSMARYGQSDPIRAFALAGGVAVPEPGTAVLALLGMVGVSAQVGRRRRSLGVTFQTV